MTKEKVELKPWEISLMCFAGILFSASSVFYAGGYSLRKYLLGMDDSNTAVKVGELGSKNRVVRRQLGSEAEFRQIEEKAPLFNYDAVVTDGEGTAVITLSDGSTIELGPGTMVRLVFETELTLGGVARVANVQVVSGRVTGKSAKTKMVIRSNEGVVELAKGTTQAVEASAPLKTAPVEPSPEPSPSSAVQLLSPPPEAVLSPVPEQEGDDKSKVRLEWSLSNPDGTAVKKEFKGLRVEPPTVGGQRTDSNYFNGELLKDFDITLRWKAYPKVKEYRVAFFAKAKSKKPDEEFKTTDLQYTIKMDKELSGQIHYQISGELPNGSIVTSGRKAFTFNFLPPVLVTPKNGATISSARPAESTYNDSLFTWRTTNFTVSYEFELASDPGFEKIILERTTTDNFVSVAPLAPGNYWWRVRSLGKSVKSPYCAPFSLKVAP